MLSLRDSKWGVLSLGVISVSVPRSSVVPAFAWQTIASATLKGGIR